MFVDPQTRLCPLRPQGRAGSVRRRIALLLGAGRGLTGRFQTGDNQGFAVFGHVAQGMDVVKKILESPTSPTEGEGVMKGQMLAPQIRIVSAKRGG